MSEGESPRDETQQPGEDPTPEAASQRDDAADPCTPFPPTAPGEGIALRLYVLVRPGLRYFPYRRGWLEFRGGLLRFTDDRRGPLFEFPRESASISGPHNLGCSLRVEAGGRRYSVLFGVRRRGEGLLSKDAEINRAQIDCAIAMKVLGTGTGDTAPAGG